MNTAISIKNLKKSFGDNLIFTDFNLEIEAGKITAIFGPNGSGKSTLLNILAGIIKPDGGNIDFDGFRHFDFSYIFQNYRESLLPWRNNFRNVALPLNIQKRSQADIAQRISELKKIFELNIDWKKYPYELSGGQQQILAFMRALATNPKILFIDEPFSALDYENNLRLRSHLQKYYLEHRPTIVLVTHNIEEAVHLADKIIILSSRPTRVVEIINNPLPYPREIESIASENFRLVKNKVLDAFRQTANI